MFILIWWIISKLADMYWWVETWLKPQISLLAKRRGTRWRRLILIFSREAGKFPQGFMMGLLGFLIGLTWWAMCMMIGRWIAGRFSFVNCVGVLALAWVVESCNFAMRSWTFHSLQIRWQRGFRGILKFMVIHIDDKGDDGHDHDLSFHGFNVHPCMSEDSNPLGWAVLASPH